MSIEIVKEEDITAQGCAKDGVGGDQIEEFWIIDSLDPKVDARPDGRWDIVTVVVRRVGRRATTLPVGSIVIREYGSGPDLKRRLDPIGLPLRNQSLLVVQVGRGIPNLEGDVKDRTVTAPLGHGASS